MILKSFEIEKKNISKFKFFLIYGENEGLKKSKPVIMEKKLSLRKLKF